MRYNICILVLLLFVLSGCEKEINLEHMRPEPKLVLNCLAVQGDTLSVELSRTWFYADNKVKDIFVSGADVKLYVNDVFRESLSEVAVKYEELDIDAVRYKSSSYIPVAGDRIRLVASRNGFKDVEAVTEVPRPCSVSGFELQQKSIKICSSLNETMTDILAEDFAKQQNVKVEVRHLPAGNLDERLNFLREGKFDVWLGGTPEEYYLAGEQKMLRSYRPREAYKVPAEMRENQWRWTGLYVDYIGFLTNRDRLRELGLYAPETWDELLKPELWEETALADFKNGGRSYGMIISIWQLRGEAKAMEYAASFNSQLPLYTASEWEAIEAVRSGRKTIAVVSLSTALQLERQNRDLFATLVKDGNKNCITGAAILQGANLAEAQSFMDYLLSEHSKDLLASKGYPLLWRVSDYAHDDGRKMMIGDLELAVDDLSWTAGQKSVIIQQWLNAQ